MIIAGTFPEANTGRRRLTVPTALTITFNAARGLAIAWLKPAIIVCQFRADCLRSPEVLRVGSQRSGTDDDRIGCGAQQSHHHAILAAESADVAPAAVSFHLKRDDAVQSADEVAEDKQA